MHNYVQELCCISCNSYFHKEDRYYGLLINKIGEGRRVEQKGREGTSSWGGQNVSCWSFSSVQTITSPLKQLFEWIFFTILLKKTFTLPWCLLMTEDHPNSNQHSTVPQSMNSKYYTEAYCIGFWQDCFMKKKSENPELRKEIVLKSEQSILQSLT